jgi:hypothetical protein
MCKFMLTELITAERYATNGKHGFPSMTGRGTQAPRGKADVFGEDGYLEAGQ